MLGMLAVGALIAGGAIMTEQAFAQPLIGATASNSDDDTVSQNPYASITQSSEPNCIASVEDNDDVQVGDNVNTASNDCDTTQTASISQPSTNTDDDIQNARPCAFAGIAIAPNGQTSISCNVD